MVAVQLDGLNEKTRDTNPVVASKCGKGRRGHSWCR
jgi:hypothetical protein